MSINVEEYSRYIEKIRSLLARDISRYCLTLFIIIIVLGVALLNIYLIYAGSGLLASMLTFLTIPRPSVDIYLDVEKSQYATGEVFNLNVRVLSRTGLGIVTCKIGIPENLEIVEGRTIFMFIKGLGRAEHVHRIVLRAGKVGTCKISVEEIELYHIFGIGGPKKMTNVTSIEITVVPYIVRVSHGPRVRPLRARIQPVHVSKLMIGAASTEFKEIRKYVPGDPVKHINWKATARLGTETPLVNEYEKESIARILIVPDLSQRTEIEGSGIHVQEDILSITFSMLRILLRKGCKISIIHPYNGKLTSIRGLREYIKLYKDIISERNKGSRGIDVIELIKDKHIRNIDYTILITYIDTSLISKIRKIRRYIKSGRIIVVDFNISRLIEKINSNAAEMYKIYKIAFHKYLRRNSIDVVEHVSGTSIGTLVHVLTCRIS